MASRRILIANALLDLTPEDLTKFTARLKEPRGDEHKPARFKQGQLNGKDHMGLADLLADSFSGNAVSITVALLRAIGANRVADDLGECVRLYARRVSVQQQNQLRIFSKTQGQILRLIYPVTLKSIKNRVALLITNITFAELKNRPGAEKDEENMEKLLSTLGYEVVKHTNLTAEKMGDALVDFSKHPKLKETDSVFVVIMSHGQYGAVHGVNHKPKVPDVLKVDDIYDNLNAMGCPALVDKPKIIIIQACRGKETGSVLKCDSVEDDAVAYGVIKEDDSQYRHKEDDFLAFLSSTPHTVSYRHISQGSFLIQFTVDIFRANVLKHHIEDLFLKVMKKFKEGKELPDHLRQMPTKDRCTLTQHFFLFPGDLKQ
uniref:Caspase 1 n=1 Tax=Neogobius melanostomus TaxID=47308 RepID=A0A8C6SQV7_9GOBI